MLNEQRTAYFRFGARRRGVSPADMRGATPNADSTSKTAPARDQMPTPDAYPTFATADENGAEAPGPKRAAPNSFSSIGASVAAFVVSLGIVRLIAPNWTGLQLVWIAVSTRSRGPRAGAACALLGGLVLLLPTLTVTSTAGTAGWYLRRETVYLGLAGATVALMERCRREEDLLRTSLRKSQSSECVLRAALLNSLVVVFEQNTDLRYTRLHSICPEGFPFPVIGKSDSELFPPEESLALTSMKREVLRTGFGKRRETRLTTGGEQRIFEQILEPLTDRSGRIVGLLGTALDVTETKRAETELRRSGEQFQQLALYLQRRHEAERESTSRQIEGNVVQLLSALNLELSVACQNLQDGASVSGAMQRMQAISENLTIAVECSDAISDALTSQILDHLGLAAAIECEARRFQSRTGISVSIHQLDFAGAPPDIALQVLRIVQERMAELLDSASVTCVEIDLRQVEQTLRLQIRDDRLQAIEDFGSGSGELALLMIQQRARQCKGTATAGALQRGAVLEVSIPVGNVFTA